MTELTPDQKAIVLKAADEIERRGLAHGTLIDYSSATEAQDCKVCTLGGLGLAYYGHAEKGYGTISPEYRDLIQAVYDALPDEFRHIDMVLSVSNWNDEGDDDRGNVRTTEEVVTFLRKLAA